MAHIAAVSTGGSTAIWRGRTFIGAGGWLQFVDGLDAAQLAAVKTEQAAAGAQVMQQVLNDRADAMNAMTRSDISGPIDFRYGRAEKDGSPRGIAHIAEKHGVQSAKRIPQIIAFGEIEPKGTHKINITLGSELVVVTDDLDGEAVNRWVLTSFDRNGEKGGAR